MTAWDVRGVMLLPAVMFSVQLTFPVELSTLWTCGSMLGRADWLMVPRGLHSWVLVHSRRDRCAMMFATVFKGTVQCGSLRCMFQTLMGPSGVYGMASFLL